MTEIKRQIMRCYANAVLAYGRGDMAAWRRSIETARGLRKYLATYHQTRALLRRVATI
jgi:hypothetical protein